MRYYILTFLICFMKLSAFAQYNCIEQSSNNESVTFRVVGYGSNSKKALRDAELSAIKTLCFAGTNGQHYHLPLISMGEVSATELHPAFFRDFYSGKYQSFIEYSYAVSKFAKDAHKRKCQTFDIRVRAEKLRAYLEQNRIVRKFGI